MHEPQDSHPAGRRAARGTAAAVLALLLAACAAPEVKEAQGPDLIAYPSPPDPPRFYFDRTLRASTDVSEFTQEVSLRLALTGETGVAVQRMRKPFSLAVHQGRVFVSDTVGRRVLAFDYRDGKVLEIGTEGPGGLAKPLGMDTDAAGNLFVADVTQQRVAVYSRDGEFLHAFGGKEHLQRPSSVAVNAEGTLAFVVDTGGVDSDRHRVAVFDARSGAFLRAIGTRGTEPGQFNLPREAAIGPDGLLYVVDGGNFRVQVFRQSGELVRTFGKVGRQFGQFARPKGIDVDSQGNVYVADAAFGNFQIFNPQGELLMFIGARSGQGGPGQYMLPSGIEVDEDGRVYIVDQFFGKVDIFRPAALAADAGYIGKPAGKP